MKFYPTYNLQKKKLHVDIILKQRSIEAAWQQKKFKIEQDYET